MANTAMRIGASKETVREARASILAILNAPHVDNTTKVVALQAFQKVCAVENTTITGCTFSMPHKR